MILRLMDLERLLQKEQNEHKLFATTYKHNKGL